MRNCLLQNKFFRGWHEEDNTGGKKVLSQVRIFVMCGSSDFLVIKEYSRELREAIYPKLRKNLKKLKRFFYFRYWRGLFCNYIIVSAILRDYPLNAAVPQRKPLGCIRQW